MIEAANAVGEAFVLAESARYEPWVTTVEDAIERGEIGRQLYCAYN